jgi:tRNA A37 threonylcarbamoyladenosine synthetase subunit TsaC/SUA5/YrdC
MRLVLDPNNPAPRRIQQVVEVLEADGVIAYPTDTVYGLGADLANKKAIERIYQLRALQKHKPLSLICADLSDIARYAQVSDAAYRLMKRLLPGPYTFVLEATKQVPPLLLRPAREIAAAFAEKVDRPQRSAYERARGLGAEVESTAARIPKREKTVGIRVPDNAVCQALCRALGRPLVNTSCMFQDEVLIDPEDIDRRLGKGLALVIDTGLGGSEPSTVVSLVGDVVEVLRAGRGPVDLLE